MAKTPTSDLARILDSPQLARTVPLLPAPVLHHAIVSHGLEACAELIALTTPEQLAAVWDLDLFRSPRPGAPESFDPARFGAWLELLVDSGADGAAARLAEADLDLLIDAFARHIAVFDLATLAAAFTDDGDEFGGATPTADDTEIGGYKVVARRSDFWDAITTALLALDTGYPDRFHDLMRGCRRLSNSTPEPDGLDDLLLDPQQAAFEVSTARDLRRESRGYVTPLVARGFLRGARVLSMDGPAPPPAMPVAAAIAGDDDAAGAVAREEAGEAGNDAAPAADVAGDLAAVIGEIMGDAPQVRPVARLGPAGAADAGDHGGVQPLLIHEQMQRLQEVDPAAYGRRAEELVFLANLVAAGCGVQQRALTPAEAFDLAVSTCNLGLESWPPHWRPADGSGRRRVPGRVPDDLLTTQELTAVFQVGWAVLHTDVCQLATRRLLEVLADVRCGDRETQSDLQRLRRELSRHARTGEPWLARERFDVLAVLDMPAWAGLLGLIAECPVLLANVGRTAAKVLSIDLSAFEFVAERRQIRLVEAFLRVLPEALSG